VRHFHVDRPILFALQLDLYQRAGGKNPHDSRR
jgi:hypothetical protein